MADVRRAWLYLCQHHLDNRVTSCLIEARQGLRRVTWRSFWTTTLEINSKSFESGLVFKVIFGLMHGWHVALKKLF